MTKEVPLNSFMHASGPIIDVRAPKEYHQGRIPNAINIPLLDNEKRAEVGITYKEQGRDKAVEVGLRLAGPELHKMVANAKTTAIEKCVRVHCWRGGIRSNFSASLFETSGLQVTTLSGGYKTFRQWALQQFDMITKYRFIVIGGLTGSGKTEKLKELQSQGEQVIDLEALANHRGSSFGMLGMPPQPSTEQFENEIATLLASYDPTKPIWIENESRLIGTCKIPDPLFHLLRTAPMTLMEVSREERLQRIIKEYGHIEKKELVAATQRLHNKLGGQRTKEAISFIESGNLYDAFSIVLQYYDKTYLYGLQQRLSSPMIKPPHSAHA